MPTPFVHLHNHSEFSLLDGATKIKDMVKYAVDMEMPAIALTDHGMMYGSMEFYMKAKAAGIKPLVGCCLPGQLIHTRTGVKPIEEIEVGEMVLTHKGVYQPVLSTMTRRYKGTIYGVAAANSETVWLTDEHPVLIKSGKSEQTEWVRADSLPSGRRAKGRRGLTNWNACVALPRLQDAGRDRSETLYLCDYLDKNLYADDGGGFVEKFSKINKWDHRIRFTIPNRLTVTPQLMRLLGLFVAEGSFTRDIRGMLTRITFTFGADEAHFADFALEAIQNIFGLKCAKSVRANKNIIEVHCHNTVIARLFEALCGAGCANKRIPNFVYTASRENIEAFVNAVVDGDGRRHPTGQVSLKMVSRNVIYGMRLLVASLGYVGVAREFTTANSRKPTYLLQWSPQGKFRKFQTTEDYLFLPLKKVQEKQYDGPVHNIEVAEHNSYVTDFALHNCELYVATRKRTDRDPRKDGNHHLVALAKNEIGYQNLLKLVTKASLEGFYYKPRVDKELLAEHSEGLIIASACLGGELCKTITSGAGFEAAKSCAAWYREVWGDDFYLEIQDHGIPEQASVNVEIKRISEQLGIKMVATNDSHYLRAEDADAHDVLICIQTGTTVEDPKRMRYEPRNFYLKNYNEMMGVFENFAPDAIENTLEVADKCNLNIEMGRVPMPAVGLPPGKTVHGHMTDLCWEGLSKRIPTHSGVHRDRLEYELGVIEKTGFSQYFLIVMDISNHARSSGIFFGVRGSAAGSLASYCLGITDLDPIEYNLTFERFLNPERVTMPDVDMDFEDARRAEVIQHVVKKYGEEQVAYITTFGTLGAKAAIRDAGRALALPMPDVDRWAKMIPALPVGMTIQKAMYGDKDKGVPGNPELVAEYENNPQATKLINTAQRLEGISRHASVHAAGIMIADKPLVNYTPLAKTADGSLVTQYPHSSLEALGLLKMDFLGLSNLTILARAIKLIKKTRNVDVDVWNIPLINHPDADKAYEMLARGETTGIFQLESAGMRKYVVDLKPASVKELSAMVALYRPGPMAHIPRYIRAKFDPSLISYTHPLLEPILKDTYGVIVYQDQVMQIVQAVAGFTLGQADLLRRAMGKKKASEMEKQREYFLKGAAEKGVSKKIAEQIYNEIEPFAGYAFNGAHAACYAMIAYQTAYLKANYPSEYLAALMGTYIDNTEKVVIALEECGRMGVEVLPPDINESMSDFTVHGKGDNQTTGAVRFGLLAIKNVGKAPIDAILAAREKGGKFASLEDFCTRVFAEGLTSKSVVEMLIKAGTFASVHPNRRALLDALDDAFAVAQRGAKDAAAGLISLFGDGAPGAGDETALAPAASAVTHSHATDFSRGERLAMEKELLGLYLSEHPIKPFEPTLRRKHNAIRLSAIKDTSPNQEITVGGLVTAVRTHYSKQGAAMLFVTLEDTSGTASVTLFPRTTSEYGKFVIKDAVIAIKGKAQHRERFGGKNQNNAGDGSDANGGEDKNVQVEIIADRVETVVANAMASDARPREVHVRVDAQTRTFMGMLHATLASRAGGSPVFLHIEGADGLEYKVKTKLEADADDALIEQVRRMLGGGQRRAWVE